MNCDRILTLKSYSSANVLSASASTTNGSDKDGGVASVNVTDINREIKAIRASRDRTGCTCKNSKVEKMTASKLKSELSSHVQELGWDPILTDSMSKADLMLKLKDVMRSCPLCTSSGCECVVLGVPCSAEVCTCLRHGYKPGEQQVCANPEGVLVFCKESVDAYRERFISRHVQTSSEKNVVSDRREKR